MKFEKIHNKGQAQLFENAYLETLTKSHPFVIWGMYIPILSYMLYRSYAILDIDAKHIIISFIAGGFFWTFFEYIAHRFVFHLVSESENARKLAYILHGNHHEYPRDKERLFMPPVPSLIISGALFIIMDAVASLFNFGRFTFSFWPGFMFGYLIYGSMHYAIHAWNPPFKWMKPLWRNHHLHHYKNEHLGFGVSTTIWDRVFGTMFDLKNEKEDKEKVKELMYEK
jgi:sterol desaturase/sphingolipid hydroxylase (fatty acid hydroxylase superfamily)